MANRFADVSDIKAGNPNMAEDVADALTALDEEIVAIEDGVLFSQIITSQQAGENLAERDAVYLDSDNKWYKIDSDDVTPKMGKVRGFVTQSGGITSGNTGKVKILGEVDGFTGLTPFGIVYASTTAGGYTQTKPTVAAAGGQKALVPMGIALSATKLLAWRYAAKYLMRESLADDGTLTIVHHADTMTRERTLRALVNTAEAGSSLTTYASANQDSDVSLGAKAVATYGSDQCTGGTASASGGTAANAFDNNNATFCYDSAALPNYIQYDLGAGVTKTARKYTLRAHPSDASIMAKSWTLGGSNDGTNFTTLDTQTNVSAFSAGEQRSYTFANATAYRYYRLDITANQGGSGSGSTVAEIEIMEASTYTDGNAALAQSFQIDPGAAVGSVKLWLKKVGSPTGNLTVKIQPDSGGNPSGTAITNGTSGTVAASTLSTSYGWITFTFATPPSLSATTTYWLVLESADSQSETNYVQWGSDGSAPGYTDGEMKSYAASTWSAETKDACFDVVGEGDSYEEAAVVGRWVGANCDLGARYDDGSGGSGDTQTSFINLSGGTLDVTCVVEME